LCFWGIVICRCKAFVYAGLRAIELLILLSLLAQAVKLFSLYHQGDCWCSRSGWLAIGNFSSGVNLIQ